MGVIRGAAAGHMTSLAQTSHIRPLETARRALRAGSAIELERRIDAVDR